ncbi:MAG: MazG nucleotide pyrophosphohydrolase domain-containing protein [Candidatus ainarchaeum sp.]|nr:MazG nucleotide pyrophosphohydrolase domain-containing protein [Candidatus ainarchaeum sp.]
MKKIQEKINKFCKDKNLDSTLEIKVLDLVSEVGEVSKEIIKGTDYGKKDFKITENTKSEIGDVLFSLITIANQLDVDLEIALEKVLEKYQKRFEVKKGIGSF